MKKGLFRSRTGYLLALCALTSLTSGCVVGPPGGGYHYREGYYDRPHHRWYHHNQWVQCRPNDMHCR